MFAVSRRRRLPGKFGQQNIFYDLGYVLTGNRLAMVACRQVLVRKQAGYRDVIAWLEEENRKRSRQKGLDVEVLVGVAKDGLVYRRGC
jgi:hypothetical protein